MYPSPTYKAYPIAILLHNRITIAQYTPPPAAQHVRGCVCVLSVRVGLLCMCVC